MLKCNISWCQTIRTLKKKLIQKCANEWEREIHWCFSKVSFSCFTCCLSMKISVLVFLDTANLFLTFVLIFKQVLMLIFGVFQKVIEFLKMSIRMPINPEKFQKKFFSINTLWKISTVKKRISCTKGLLWPNNSISSIKNKFFSKLHQEFWVVVCAYLLFASPEQAFSKIINISNFSSSKKRRIL